jgi:ABC-2 type transport system permease protein
MRRIRFLVWKELLELGRDPRLLSIVILAPLIQLIVLGYAATTDIRNVPVVIADADRSTASREIVERFSFSPLFTVAALVTAGSEVDQYLERGEAWLAVVIPAGYGGTAALRRPAALQILADGSDANSAGLALGYAAGLIDMHVQQAVAGPGADPAERGGAVLGTMEPRVRIWFNPRLESRDFMIPGIVALLLLVVTTSLSSMGIVREKEIGTLEQLNVTPIGRAELIVGKLLPYALVGLVDVLVVLAVAVFWFTVPLRGSIVLLLAMTPVFLLSTLGLGLFVSTISSTQQQAMMTTIFFFLMPMVLLSGFVFPIENMPEVIQWVTYLIPLRYFLVILRAIFLKGVGLEALWPQALALAAWGVAILWLAVLRSSKRAA